MWEAWRQHTHRMPWQTFWLSVRVFSTYHAHMFLYPSWLWAVLCATLKKLPSSRAIWISLMHLSSLKRASAWHLLPSIMEMLGCANCCLSFTSLLPLLKELHHIHICFNEIRRGVYTFINWWHWCNTHCTHTLNPNANLDIWPCFQ